MSDRAAKRFAHRRARAGAVALVLVTLALHACGRSRSTEETVDLSELPPDSLRVLAGDVASQFSDLALDTLASEQKRSAVHGAAYALARAVLERERPESGWTPPAFEEALRNYELAAEVRETQTHGPPWIALLGDPRGSGAPEVAVLVYPDPGVVLPIVTDPFRMPYQSATWSDSAGAHLLIAGSRRSPAGPQPAAWVFDLPRDANKADRGRVLRARNEWGLAGAGYGRVTLRRDSTAGPPLIAITNSTLPNPLFDECASCPHIEADLVYRIDRSGLTSARRVIRPSPYAAFVRFVQALVDGDRVAASGFVADSSVLEQADRFGFAYKPRGGRWRIAPGTSPKSLDAVYLRGNDGAFRVLMAPGDTNYVVTSITPTVHSLD